MKRLFKYSIISLLCMISFSLQAQTTSDSQTRVSFQTGYVRGSSGGSSSYKINDGMQFKLSSDWKIANSNKWFAGFGLSYLRTSIDHLAPQSIAFDAYSLTFRGGWEATIAKNLLLRGVIESGPAYMQSRHQYDGARYKTYKPTVMLGIEVGAEYQLTKSLGLNASFGVTRYGNDNLQHDGVSVLNKPLYINPISYSIGISYTPNW